MDFFAKSIVRSMIGTVAILMIPLIAMRLTNEVKWDHFDFMVMGSMLLVTGFLIDQAWSRMGAYRVVAVLIVLLLFLWLWGELAVGIFSNLGN